MCGVIAEHNAITAIDMAKSQVGGVDTTRSIDRNSVMDKGNVGTIVTITVSPK
jgi:hypothetical protein